MRSNGIDEYYITGGASDRERFPEVGGDAGARNRGSTLSLEPSGAAAGDFGYTGYLNGDTAEEVWQLCNAKLQEDELSVRNIIRRSGVKLICTTDDPADSLQWHKSLREDKSFEVQVLPAWRPDKAMNLEKPDYPSYIARLSEVSGVAIQDFSDLKAALLKRMELLRIVWLPCIRSCAGVCHVITGIRRRG